MFPRSYLLAATLAGAAALAHAIEPTQLHAPAIDSGRTVALPQIAAVLPQTTVEGQLLTLAQQAGVIFAGQVLRVTALPSFTPGSGVVEVEFRVDQAIRGCTGQPTYTLREWSGLWTGGRQRYLPGQQLLVFLHAPSASGLSSPVGGQTGIIPITGEGPAPRPDSDFDATFLAQAEPTVDLRWIESRLLRSATAMQGRHPALTLPSTPGSTGHRRVPVETHTSTISPLSTAVNAPFAANAIASPDRLPLASGITLRGLLAILGAWEAEHGNAAH